MKAGVKRCELAFLTMCCIYSTLLQQTNAPPQPKRDCTVCLKRGEGWRQREREDEGRQREEKEGVRDKKKGKLGVC